jgi:hypothetical protein
MLSLLVRASSQRSVTGFIFIRVCILDHGRVRQVLTSFSRSLDRNPSSSCLSFLAFSESWEMTYVSEHRSDLPHANPCI